jgi:hypothetical protein
MSEKIENNIKNIQENEKSCNKAIQAVQKTLKNGVPACGASAKSAR